MRSTLFKNLFKPAFIALFFIFSLLITQKNPVFAEEYLYNCELNLTPDDCNDTQPVEKTWLLFKYMCCSGMLCPDNEPCECVSVSGEVTTDSEVSTPAMWDTAPAYNYCPSATFVYNEEVQADLDYCEPDRTVQCKCFDDTPALPHHIETAIWYYCPEIESKELCFSGNYLEDPPVCDTCDADEKSYWDEVDQTLWCVKISNDPPPDLDDAGDYEYYLPTKEVDAWALINNIAMDETTFFSKIYDFMFPIGVVAGVAGIVMAGYTYMTSEGRPDKVKDANERLTQAITGLIFIVLSLVILRLIINTLFGASI